MSSITVIEYPEDFEKRYKKYKDQLLRSSTKNTFSKIPSDEPKATEARVELPVQKHIHEHIQKIEITSMPKVELINAEKKTLSLKNEPESFIKDLVIGPLVYRKDGAILYKQNILKMRPQLKTLCILFMNKHKNFIDYSTIKDELIPAKKISTTSSETITKYVNELHKLLKKHFKRDVIFNQEKEGYIFDTERNS